MRAKPLGNRWGHSGPPCGRRIADVPARLTAINCQSEKLDRSSPRARDRAAGQLGAPRAGPADAARPHPPARPAAQETHPACAAPGRMIGPQAAASYRLRQAMGQNIRGAVDLLKPIWLLVHTASYSDPADDDAILLDLHALIAGPQSRSAAVADEIFTIFSYVRVRGNRKTAGVLFLGRGRKYVRGAAVFRGGCAGALRGRGNADRLPVQVGRARYLEHNRRAGEARGFSRDPRGEERAELADYATVFGELPPFNAFG